MIEPSFTLWAVRLFRETTSISLVQVFGRLQVVITYRTPANNKQTYAYDLEKKS